MALRRGSLGTAVRTHSGGDEGGWLTWKRAPRIGRRVPSVVPARSPDEVGTGLASLWGGAPSQGSSACPRITPRRKTVPGLVPGRGQSEPHGPRTGPSWTASRKAVCGFLAGHIPVTLEHSCTRRGPAVTRIPCLKGFPGSGRGAAITPGLLLTAREGGGWSSGRRTRVGGKSSGCRRSGGSLPGAQLRLEAEPPTGLRTARGAAAALGKAGSLPGLDPLSPGPSAGQVLPWQPHVQPVCPLGGHIASPPVPGDPAT